MTYAALGFYDRRQSSPERFPACATTAEKQAAKNACKPTEIRGIDGLGAALGAVALAGTRFEGANPCWVETLPDCPTCLTGLHMLQYGKVIRGDITGAEAMKIAHLRDIYACSSVTSPPLPGCIDYKARPLLDYCEKYPSYNGPNRDLNVGCWAAKRYRYGGIGGGWYSVLRTKKDCPKCLTAKEAFAFAECVKRGHAQKSGPGIDPLCNDPRIGWTLCPGEPVPAVPKCLTKEEYALVQYCKKAGGTDNEKNYACYLAQRAPDYWRAIAALAKCPPVCIEEKKCWDGTKICVRKQAPGEAAFATNAKCPPMPPPQCIDKETCWDKSLICKMLKHADGKKTATKEACPPPPPPKCVQTVQCWDGSTVCLVEEDYTGKRTPTSKACPPEPRRGLSTGSILLLVAAVGGGAYYLSKRKKKGK